tara:strand:- start:125 stop:457 length:333 start_codon:yes stop_codon:yes gene_type:complete
MALNYNLAQWSWEQGGQIWGFDPRITNPIATWEKIARDALTEDQRTAIVTAQAWKCVRKQRDILIAETDWVGGSDVPEVLKNKWNTYRQELRDVTNQSDPENINWPTKPS